MLNAVRRGVARGRRVRSEAPDAGISLTELLVTMVLLSIVGALALSVLVGTTNSTDRTTETSFSTADGRTAVSAWTALLQVAVPPAAADGTVRGLSITPTSITFNAQLANKAACSASGSCPTGEVTQVTLALRTITDAGSPLTQLVQTLTTSSGTRTAVVVRSGAAAGSCLFTPYSASGTAYACTGLTSAKLAAVARVDLAFSVTPRVGGVQNFATTVSLPGRF